MQTACASAISGADIAGAFVAEAYHSEPPMSPEDAPAQADHSQDTVRHPVRRPVQPRIEDLRETRPSHKVPSGSHCLAEAISSRACADAIQRCSSFTQSRHKPGGVPVTAARRNQSTICWTYWLPHAASWHSKDRSSHCAYWAWLSRWTRPRTHPSHYA